MRYALVSLVLAGAVLAAGCISTKSDVGAMVTVTKSCGQVADGVVAKSPKVGRAEARGIVVVALGDSSIDAACKAGGITKIHYVDYETLNILSVYGRVVTVVYGE